MSKHKSGNTIILGISAFYHDSAAALLVNGDIVAAAQEERFTRIKHDSSFPSQAIQFCLNSLSLSTEDIDHIVYYDKPFPKFERILETYLYSAPHGLMSFVKSMPVWLKEKLFLKSTLKKSLNQLSDELESTTSKTKLGDQCSLLFSNHHQAHAASAFYPSPFKEAVIVCLDGVGEWETSSIWKGDGNNMQAIKQLNFPHSVGLLYSAFTYYLGFKVNSGEYKMMGLAPYGKAKYVELIENNLLDIKADGSFRLNLRYFDFCTGLKMTNQAFDTLLGQARREPESELTQFHMDVAASIQKVTEQIIFKIINHAAKLSNTTNLCLAGGVALNCVANGKIVENTCIENIWIQPAAGDDGGALGAALSAHHQHLDNKRVVSNTLADQMKGSYLGPEFSKEAIKETLDTYKVNYVEHPASDVAKTTAQLIANGHVIGWFQGKMEFGPRSLGGRSILADPRSIEMQSKLNLKIKQRESFRPFAPAVLKNKVSEYFNTHTHSPYMLLVSEVAPSQRVELTSNSKEGLFRLKETRSTIPAVTHVDYTARVQTVDDSNNKAFFQLLTEFDALTGCAVLVNTSFNVRGEPIVCTPEDALSCFMRTGMDYLVLDGFIIDKKAQSKALADTFSSISFSPD